MLAAITDPVRHAISAEVRAVFANGDRRKRPTPPPPADPLFPPDAVIRRVHGDVTGMMAGGIAGLLLQMLHPGALAGVWDHSSFRDDMSGRLRNTAQFIAVTTFGGHADAAAAIARVRRIHAKVSGTLPDGTPYAADEPDLLAWVHVTGATSFLAGWRRYGEPGMSRADRDTYFAQAADMAAALGADPVPRDEASAQRLIRAMRPALAVDHRTRDVARTILDPPQSDQGRRAARAEPVVRLMLRAGVDLLPDWARRMHALPLSLPEQGLIRLGTAGLARTLRWAQG